VSLGALLEGAPEEITVSRQVSLTVKRRGVEMRLVILGNAAREPRVDQSLLKEVARAHRCFEALRTSLVADVAGIEGIDSSYLSRPLPLAFFAPDIVEAIARGTQPPDMTAKKLIRDIDLPLAWRAQRQILGFRQHNARRRIK
jgi:site-specific DNA recombinase